MLELQIHESVFCTRVVLFFPQRDMTAAEVVEGRTHGGINNKTVKYGGIPLP